MKRPRLSRLPAQRASTQVAMPKSTDYNDLPPGLPTLVEFSNEGAVRNTFEDPFVTEQVPALLAAIVESSDDAIVSKTLDGIVTSWNKAAERIFGYTAKEMIGQPIAKLACVGGEDDLLHVINQVRAGKRVDHYETRRRCKDGREIFVSLTVSPVRDRSGKIIGASKIVRDITERKLTEETLQKADKLALASRMTASIAHEINNPLEAITNILYLMEQEPIGDQARQYLILAQHELTRVSHITAQTLAFFRGTPVSSSSDVSTILDAALTLHRGRLATSSIQLERDYHAVPEIICNQGELRQVFANFINNAVDAMPSGGRLRIKIRPATSPTTHNHGVRVSIVDNGEGMTPETSRRLFEAFYTTQGATGSGLGLWVCNEIITRHGGRIAIQTSQDPSRHGTVFSIFLPSTPPKRHSALRQDLP
ncbi:MAG: sensor histidine kinase [Edaphobacter sp.]|nr:sensor histidine kinase [Edaphobacter sp.]